MSDILAEPSPLSSNGHVDPDIKQRLLVGDFGPVRVTKQSQRYQLGMLGLPGVPLDEELGRSGLRHWGGFLFEEWLRELQQGARAAQVFREMSDSDPIVGAILYAIEMLCRRVTWWTEPAKTRGADWLWGVLNDMSFSWTDTMSEIFSFLTYGWSMHELIFKVRQGESLDPNLNSKFNDGTIGLAKLPLRAQDSIWKWVFDDPGNILGMIQNPPPDYLLRFVPIEKALHFRTRIFKNDPEARSILRTAYRPWYFLRNLQNIEGIGLERDLAGLPVLQPPEGVDIWDASDPAMVSLFSMAKNVVSSIRRDEQEGVIIPSGWELKLLSTGGKRQFNTTEIIGRYEHRIATSVLADMVLLGQDKVGSYALAATKKDLFGATLEAFLDIVSSVVNTQLIPRLWRLNGFKDEMPTLEHGAVETIDLDTLGNFLKNIAGAGAPIDWGTVLPYALDQAGMPQSAPDAE